MRHAVSARPSHLLHPIAEQHPRSWDVSRPVGELLSTTGSASLRFPLVGIVLVSVMDFVLTWLLIGRYPIASESNPVAQSILSYWGWAGLFCFKMALTAMPILIICWIRHRHQKLAILAARVILTIIASVVVYSSILLATNLKDAHVLLETEQRNRSLEERLGNQKCYWESADQVAVQMVNSDVSLAQGVDLLRARSAQLGHVGLFHVRVHFENLSDDEAIALDLIRRTLHRIPHASERGQRMALRLRGEHKQLFGYPLPEIEQP